MNQRKSHCKGIYLIPCVHLCQVEPVHLEFLSLKHTSIHGSMKYFLSSLRFYFRLNNKFKPFWISITTLGSFLILFNSLLLNSYCKCFWKLPFENQIMYTFLSILWRNVIVASFVRRCVFNWKRIFIKTSKKQHRLQGTLFFLFSRMTCT